MINYTLISGETSFRGVVAARSSARSFTRGRFTNAAQRAYKSANACAGARRPNLGPNLSAAAPWGAQMRNIPRALGHSQCRTYCGSRRAAAYCVRVPDGGVAQTKLNGAEQFFMAVLDTVESLKPNFTEQNNLIWRSRTRWSRWNQTYGAEQLARRPGRIWLPFVRHLTVGKQPDI